eukprot:CAMPEP_0178942578 /NCGR_PEP_ID=MMETSP0789-20121207/2074_1 /TAXON_ID=3005 /ORGANISM="Rhizosolenia setigera, Strain CCMP 1694" /LENGTH=709 /DNA_ID=CAMNT_0020622007 /DNA_START=98 /DNA_END=2227 /DNA_ORIENTATION=+
MVKTKVQLLVHAHKLPNVDGIFKGKSDPYAVVTIMANKKTEHKVLGRTETILNSVDPSWTKAFFIDYELHKESFINIGIYHEIGYKKSKSMGSALFEIGDILGSRGNTRARKLKKGGIVYVSAKKLIAKEGDPNFTTGFLGLQLYGIKLKNKDGFFGKSDPFFELSCKMEGTDGNFEWKTVLRSKAIRNNLNPHWMHYFVNLLTLCDGDLRKTILLSVFDHEKSGRHKLIGTIETTTSRLLEKGKIFGLLSKSNKKSGEIVVKEAFIKDTQEETEDHIKKARERGSSSGTGDVDMTFVSNQNAFSLLEDERMFVDYISSGFRLGSNGDPTIPGTLHYIDKFTHTLNDYEKVITALGGIISKYDWDKKFPMWGFGAKFDGILRNCFQIGEEPQVNGVQGMLKAYRNVFRRGFIMSGPTEFHEVINEGAQEATQAEYQASIAGHHSYTVLLILTDGSCHDIDETKAALLAASDSPLSVIIAGVGDASFRSMQFLDDFSNEEKDITQFVEFNKYQDDKAALAEATLTELPSQFVRYYSSRGIHANPNVQGNSGATLEDLSIYGQQPIGASDSEDLDINVHGDGEVVVGAAAGATYIDTSSYGTATDYLNDDIPMAVPLVSPSAPPAATAPVPTQSYNSNGAGSEKPAATYPVQSIPSVTATPVVAPRSFQLQVPNGVDPGMQITVKNPMTGQLMNVVVPPGVPPGGLMEINY